MNGGTFFSGSVAYRGSAFCGGAWVHEAAMPPTAAATEQRTSDRIHGFVSFGPMLFASGYWGCLLLGVNNAISDESCVG
jgi:hypothetical protein